VLGLAALAAVGAAVAGAVFATEERPLCACSIEPSARYFALNAADRFEASVRGGDLTGAWAQLTPGAQARYVDPAGFRPVFERLGTALRGLTGDQTRWLPIADEIDYSMVKPSDLVVARYSTGPTRPLWAMVVRVPPGPAGHEQVDPEPGLLTVRAKRDDHGGVLVEFADGEPTRTWVTTVDGAGMPTLPRQESVSPGARRLSWPAPPSGTVLTIVVGRDGERWLVGWVTA
jgi:hypothetical protein